jgi:hypothetical protein
MSKTSAGLTTQGKTSVDSRAKDVDSFLAKVRAMPVPAVHAGRGRLIFAMDATMSRNATWDRAQSIQAEMFEETSRIGGLDVQLVYFRGYNECRASKWVSEPKALAKLMSTVECRGGNTQIGRTLSHIKAEIATAKVNAVVLVGDAMEENIDALCQTAGEIGLRGTKIFTFHEGDDRDAARAFREIARLSGGVYCKLDSASAKMLRELLTAVAVYAAGGRVALENHAKAKGGGSVHVLQYLK